MCNVYMMSEMYVRCICDGCCVCVVCAWCAQWMDGCAMFVRCVYVMYARCMFDVLVMHVRFICEVRARSVLQFTKLSQAMLLPLTR